MPFLEAECSAAPPPPSISFAISEVCVARLVADTGHTQTCRHDSGSGVSQSEDSGDNRFCVAAGQSWVFPGRVTRAETRSPGAGVWGWGARCPWGGCVLRQAQRDVGMRAAGAGLEDKTPVAAFLLCVLGDGPSGRGAAQLQPLLRVLCRFLRAGSRMAGL